MTAGPTIGSHRFEGQSLQTMYSWMHEQGNGAGSAQTARAALVQLGALLSDVENDMRTALRAVGVEWVGAAAASAGQAVRQSAQWVGDAGRVSATSCRPAGDQGEAFTTARSQIQQPRSAEYGFGAAMADGFNIATEVTIGPFNPFEVQTDVDRAAKRNAADHAAAVQAMTTWNSAAQTNLAAMTPVDAPRPIAVDAAAATGAQQPAVGYGGSPVPFGPAGATGYAPAAAPVTAQHLAPGPAAAPPTGRTGAEPGGRSPQPGLAVPGAGAGIGPAVTGGSDRPRNGPPARGGVSPAGRTGVSTMARGGLPGRRGVGPGEGGAVPGPGGMARSGLGSAGPPGAAGGAGRAGPAPGGPGRAGGSFLHPAATGSGRGDDGDEHQNRYWQKDSGIFEDNRLVAPPVIGEDPQQ